MSTARYALYAAPRDSETLWRFGSSLIGYDAERGVDCAAPDLSGFSREEWFELTREPRQYGFHATLKAPFHLVAGRSEAELVDAVASFSRKRAAPASFALTVAGLGPFFALIPRGQPTGLSTFAGDVVEAFDEFRAPLSAEDMARRKPDTLPPRERAYLERWGYPYVFDAFRFHMTLTGRIAPERRPAVETLLKDLYARLPPEAFHLGDIVLFKQASREARFVILSRHALQG